MKKLIYLLAIALMGTTACRGPQGPAGPPGQDGQDADGGGNSNVYTYYYDANMADFQQDATTLVWYNTSFYISDITVYEDDAVLVYLLTNNYGESYDYWAMLPFNEYYDDTDFYNHHYFEVNAIGDIILNIQSADGLEPFQPMTGTLPYKIILITNGLKKGHVNQIPEWLDVNDHNAVKSYYKID